MEKKIKVFYIDWDIIYQLNSFGENMRLSPLNEESTHDVLLLDVNAILGKGSLTLFM